MNIKLKGDLESDLRALGLKEGDQVAAVRCPVSTVGAVHFDIYKFGSIYNCVVWPENYDVLTETKN
jgi:hypothetical protein